MEAKVEHILLLAVYNIMLVVVQELLVLTVDRREQALAA
jgi:hypothetical protein